MKAASGTLNNAGETVSLKVYSHVLPGMGEQAAEAMDRVFSVSR